ncbi:MAG: AbrB/MazE/SpoVT family DNA-binding domain-containing protein [Firmicutes bacterium]|nr:AbrB/MazE/SpoVT family DNA-binding domain-containing protein [Bacillota bacterium]MBR6684475.1 AbrB/MazE/SpoVT family DNA-binding domain-containing protein [Bacillota bacterium]
MLAELRTKSQITIPKEIIKKLNLSEGDKLEVYEKDGMIYMIPVVVYPKKYVDDLLSELNEIKAKIASGEQPIFDNVEDLFEKLEDN